MNKLLDYTKKIISDNRTFWILLIGIYLISRMATWFYPFDSDHWIFYYVGKNWLHGGSLYVTAWDHKPPMIFLINGLMSWFLGGNIIVHRVFFTILSLVDIFLFWKLLKMVLPKLFLPSLRGTKQSRDPYVAERASSASQDDKGGEAKCLVGRKNRSCRQSWSDPLRFLA